MLFRRLIVPGLLLLMSLGVTSTAHAEESGLDIKVLSAGPAVLLTNNTGKACQIVGGSALGTVAFTKVEQDGKVIAAQPTEVSFAESLELLLTQRLRTLEPGQSAEVPLAVTKDGTLLEMVTWSPSAGTNAAIFPLEKGKPLSLEVVYSVPVTGDEKVPVCPPATVRATAGGSDATGSPQWMFYAGGAVIVLLILLALFWLLRRKRRGPVAGAAALILAMALGISAPGEPAHATITNTDTTLQGAFDSCMSTLRQPGNDPSGILPALDAAGVTITIHRPDHPGDDHTTALSPERIFIFWDPDTPHTYHGGGGAADPCTTLYHELYHAWQHNQHTYSRDECATSDGEGRTLERSEVEATHAQNGLRRILGLPLRDHYGDVPLPDDCKPPQPPGSCEGPSCGDSNGDPHLLTFDGKRYDFQAAGEFVLSRQTTSGYEVQVRQQPVSRSRQVAVNTSVAMKVGQDKVEIRQTEHGPELLIGGELKPWRNSGVNGGSVKIDRDRAEIEWRDGPKAFVRPIGRWGLHVTLQPDADQVGKLEGLLGDFDGNSANDIKAHGGTPIAVPDFKALYPAFADSWRITQQTSLFTYAPGTSTETFTDKNFPDAEIVVDNLPNRAMAEAICRRHGVTDPVLLIGCIVDVALTGQADFAEALGAGQEFTGGHEFEGPKFAVRLDKRGDTATVEFDGTAGQQVFIDIPGTTLPNNCGALSLLAPDGKELKSGCIISHRGYIDATKLPVTGKYKVTVEARTAPGMARLTVITITDQTGTLTPGAAPTVVRLDKPGMTGRFTIAGRKDQKIYVDVPRSSLTSQCGILDLLGPDGRAIHSGCIVNGEGELDGFVLPADGTYTVTIDPHDRRVGDAAIRLINAIDQRATITPNGPAVIARIQQPGAESFFTFSGTAGQRIFVEAPVSSLPSQCGVLDLAGPNGDIVTSGCIVGGDGGIAERDGFVLAATGTYTIIVDPNAAAVGDATLRLKVQ